MTLLPAICTIFLATSLQAQAPQGPPKPGPELKRLSYNIGTWNATGEAKPFAGMPGGNFKATEKCEWYSGGFFVMCHSDGTGPMGPEKGVSFSGYDPNEKVYTYHEFTSTGDAIDAKGTVSGDTWNWTAESKMGDTKVCASPSRKYLRPNTRSNSRCRRTAESFRLSKNRQAIK
jgi:hypothetical protein